MRAPSARASSTSAMSRASSVPSRIRRLQGVPSGRSGAWKVCASSARSSRGAARSSPRSRHDVAEKERGERRRLRRPFLQAFDGHVPGARDPRALELVDVDAVARSQVYELSRSTALTGHAFNGDIFMGSFAPAHYLKQFHPKYVGQAELDRKVKDAKFDSWVRMFLAKNDWARAKIDSARGERDAALAHFRDSCFAAAPRRWAARPDGAVVLFEDQTPLRRILGETRNRE